MTDKIKFTIIGFGHIGRKHAEMISHNNDCELVAIIDEKNLTELNLEGFETLPFFNDLYTFFNADIATDVVCVATPNGFHFAQASDIIEQKINVVIEKPISLSSQQAQTLIEKAEENGVQIFPVMQNRYSPPSLWIKDLVKNKILGKIFLVQLSCFWNRDERYYTGNNWRGTKYLDGGTLYTQFSHYLDILLWLFGDISNINSKFADFNHQNMTAFEDSGIITFDLKEGGIGSFTFSTAVYKENLESSITIIAEKGSVKIGGQYMDKVEKCLIKDYEMPILEKTNGSNDYGSHKGSAQNHQYIFENIVAVLRNNTEFSTKASESVHLIDVIEQMYNSNPLQKN